MSAKVHKELRRQERTMAALEPEYKEEGKKARYISVRLMPLIPFVAMICMSDQGMVLLPDVYRSNLLVGLGGCLMYLSFWWVDYVMLKKNGWEIGKWIWLGLLPPIGFVYLWFRAKYTDKDYGFAIAYFIMKAISVVIIGPMLFI